MVWINYKHHNYSVAPGKYGGALCLCPECEKKRREAIERETRLDMDVWPELVEK